MLASRLSCLKILAATPTSHISVASAVPPVLACPTGWLLGTSPLRVNYHTASGYHVAVENLVIKRHHPVARRWQAARDCRAPGFVLDPPTSSVVHQSIFSIVAAPGRPLALPILPNCPFTLFLLLPLVVTK